MKLIALICFTIIFMIALIFSVLNFHLVQINLFFTTLQLPLALVLVMQLITGIIIGVLAIFYQMIQLKTQYTDLNKKLSKVEKRNNID